MWYNWYKKKKKQLDPQAWENCRGLKGWSAFDVNAFGLGSKQNFKQK